MYKKGDYQNAIDAFTRALVTDDEELEANANYNIANSKYRLGNLRVNTDLAGAVNHYREALDYYKRAIEIDQDDSDAKYNHELVEKKLKVLLDRLKNQPEQGQGEEESQDQNQVKQDQQSAAESGDSEQKEETSGTDERGETGIEQQDYVNEGEGQAEVRSPDDETDEMSPEEARMLLDAYGEEEALQMKKNRQGYYDGVLKDW
jgi:tetratricopeptide (TPR) repeat protein